MTTNIPKYSQQYSRVLRWHDRFKQISEGKEDITKTELYQDDVFAFFQNCYHLKEWIKNDPEAGSMCSKVESFINNSTALKLCGDIANGTKHLELDNSRSGKFAKLGEKVHKITFGEGPAKIMIGYLVIAGEEKYDALEIANQCIMDWATFFTLNKPPA